jgi:APA family basic amino acid/polyamine antiporter
MASGALSRGIRIYQLFTLAFGTTIGIGWVIMAGKWILTAGSLGAIIAFAIGAALMLLVCLAYVELSAMYPETGGEVVYVREAFGRRASFIVGWLLALVYISICAFLSIVTAWIISLLVPAIKGQELYSFLGTNINSDEVIIPLLGTAVLTWLHYCSSKGVVSFQNIATAILGLVSLVFIVFSIMAGDVGNLQPFFQANHENAEAGFSEILGITTVLITTPVWYSGFNTLPQALGEVTDVSRTRRLLAVVILSVILAAVFYCSIILATAIVVPREQISEFGMAVADAMFYAFESPWVGRLVLIAGFLGVITSWNALFFAAARVIYSLSHAGMLPPFLCTVHPVHGSPVGAIYFVAVVSGLGALLGRKLLDPLVSLVALGMIFAYIMVTLSVMKLRRSQPDIPRPFKFPLYPYLPLLSCVTAIAMFGVTLYITWTSPRMGYNLPLEWVTIIAWFGVGFLLMVLHANQLRVKKLLCSKAS